MTVPTAPAGLDWLRAPALVPDETARSAALARQASLTKPPGALGRLEALAVRLASLQGRAMPRVGRVRIVVFAADHGVAAEGVSAFPQAVTRQMLGNFAAGGAAICVLARELGADLELVDLGTVAGSLDLPGICNAYLGAGSANLARGPAMSGEQLALALGEGRAAVQRTLADGAELFIAGEMGIGNTTVAAALACALLGRPGADLTGPGTGLDRQGVVRKAAVVDRALALHRDALADPCEALRRLGGFEIAAMTGAYVACAQLGVPALVDGFIAGVAALAAVRLCPGAKDWLLYAHNSAEPGHALVLEALAAEPLLALDLRLGEGSGAALALPLLRLACALHADMATFAEAGVSDGRPVGG